MFELYLFNTGYFIKLMVSAIIYGYTDMLFSSVKCIIKSTKWYKKLFFRIIDISVLNAYSLYKTTMGKHIPLTDFQLELIRQLILKHGKRSSTSRKGK